MAAERRKDADTDNSVLSVNGPQGTNLLDLLHLFVLQAITSSDTKTISRPTALKRLQAIGDNSASEIVSAMVRFANQKRPKHTPPTTEFTLAFYTLEADGVLLRTKSSYALSASGQQLLAKMTANGDFLSQVGVSPGYQLSQSGNAAASAAAAAAAASAAESSNATGSNDMASSRHGSVAKSLTRRRSRKRPSAGARKGGAGSGFNDDDDGGGSRSRSRSRSREAGRDSGSGLHGGGNGGGGNGGAKADSDGSPGPDSVHEAVPVMLYGQGGFGPRRIVDQFERSGSLVAMSTPEPKPKPKNWLLRDGGAYSPRAHGSASPSSFRSYLGCHNLPLNAVTTAEDAEPGLRLADAALSGEAADAADAAAAASDAAAAAQGGAAAKRRESLDATDGLQLYHEPYHETWQAQQEEVEKQNYVRESKAKEHRIRLVFESQGSPAPEHLLVRPEFTPHLGTGAQHAAFSARFNSAPPAVSLDRRL